MGQIFSAEIQTKKGKTSASIRSAERWLQCTHTVNHRVLRLVSYHWHRKKGYSERQVTDKSSALLGAVLLENLPPHRQPRDISFVNLKRPHPQPPEATRTLYSILQEMKSTKTLCRNQH